MTAHVDVCVDGGCRDFGSMLLRKEFSGCKGGHDVGTMGDLAVFRLEMRGGGRVDMGARICDGRVRDFGLPVILWGDLGLFR